MASFVCRQMYDTLTTKQIIPKESEAYLDNDPKIKHVIILVMENRSFDQILGAMPGVNGMPIGSYNLDNTDNQVIAQKLTSVAEHICLDPPHTHETVMESLENNNSNFVKVFQAAYPDADEQRQLIMDYYDWKTINATHTLAEQFCVCDNWFSSVPGPTDPNRQFITSGTSKGITGYRADFGWQTPWTQPTIFDLLTDNEVPWRCYYGDYPQVTYNSSMLRYLENIQPMKQFYSDVKNGTLPAVSYIEPAYVWGENDMHPGIDIRRGDNLIAEIYNILQSNRVVWESTLLIITFDEHGGSYDHVPPPTTISPDDCGSDVDGATFDFTVTGVRVPTILISPWIKPGVDHTRYDHTAIPRYLIDKFSLMEVLGDRVKHSNSFTHLLTDRCRNDCPDILALYHDIAITTAINGWKEYLAIFVMLFVIWLRRLLSLCF
jgi:phospholipase C